MFFKTRTVSMRRVPQKFTADWFTPHIGAWKALLKPLRDKRLDVLEVGTYEGRCALWLARNILNHHPRSRVFCIDNFVGVPVTPVTGPQVERTFRANTQHERATGRIVLLKGDSAVQLRTLYKNRQSFDVIYIDCDHGARRELEDAVLCYAVLKPGGLLIFDDNTFSEAHDNSCPKKAIDAFVSCYSDEIDVIAQGWQVVVRKRMVPRVSEFCQSEAYPRAV